MAQYFLFQCKKCKKYSGDNRQKNNQCRYCKSTKVKLILKSDSPVGINKKIQKLNLPNGKIDSLDFENYGEKDE